MKKVIFFAISSLSFLYVLIGFWSGSELIYKKNETLITEFIKTDWSRICYRESGKIHCGGEFEVRLEELEKIIKENREKGVKIFSVRATLTGWSDIFCNSFDIVALDFYWPVRQ
jgi:hypothetical protein